MFKKILVPLDGSELAERALEPALKLVKKSGGEIILLRVPFPEKMFTTYPTPYGLIWPDQSLRLSREETAEYLQALQEELDEADFTLRTKMVEGGVAGAIVDTAAAEGVDLIVMSTHGYSGFTRWMLGSVTERVLRQATMPVMAVRQDKEIRRVIIALDGSPLSEVGLLPGLRLADQLEAAVTLLRVIPGPEAESVSDAGERSHEQQQLWEQVEQYLADLIEKHRRPAQKVDQVVVSGAPAPAILAQIERRQADLIVMATHGRTGLRRWVYGSVAEKILRSAHVSTMIIRPPDERLNG